MLWVKFSLRQVINARPVLYLNPMSNPPRYIHIYIYIHYQLLLHPTADNVAQVGITESFSHYKLLYNSMQKGKKRPTLICIRVFKVEKCATKLNQSPSHMYYFITELYLLFSFVLLYVYNVAEILLVWKISLNLMIWGTKTVVRLQCYWLLQIRDSKTRNISMLSMLHD